MFTVYQGEPVGRQLLPLVILRHPLRLHGHDVLGPVDTCYLLH